MYNMATARAGGKSRKWTMSDAGDDAGDQLKLYDSGTTPLEKVRSPKCLSTGMFAMMVIGMFIIFLSGLLVGYYVKKGQSESLLGGLTTPCPGSGRTDGLTASQVTDVHRDVSGFLLADDVDAVLRKFSDFRKKATTFEELEKSSANFVLREFRRHGVDKVTLEEQEVVTGYPDPDHPNELLVLGNNGSVHHRVMFNQSQPVSRPSHFAQGSRTSRDVGNKSKDDMMFDPPFVAHTTPGVVEGSLVYGYYGLPSDLDLLEDSGIDLKDKILLLRLGTISVYDKLNFAHKYGCKGVLLYLDPYDLRKEMEVSTGMPIFTYIPSVSAEDYRESRVTGKIPAQTVSMETAQLLLRKTGPPSAPREWRTTSGFLWNVGGQWDESLRVRLTVNQKKRRETIHNVVAVINGDMEVDRHVIIGASRHYGNNIGTSHLLSLTRSVATVRRLENWRLRRGLKLISWGGSSVSPGSGSIQHMEKHTFILTSRSVSYFNLDLHVDFSDDVKVPTLEISSSPLLSRICDVMATQIPDPAFPEMTIGDRGLQLHSFRKSVDIDTGYTYLWREAGVPVAIHGYTLPVQHTLSDDSHHYKFHLRAAQVISLVSLGLADEEMLSVDLTFYSRTIRACVDTLIKNNLHKDSEIAQKLLEQTKELQSLSLVFNNGLTTLNKSQSRAFNDAILLVDKIMTAPSTFRAWVSSLDEGLETNTFQLLSWMTQQKDREEFISLLVTRLQQVTSAVAVTLLKS